VIGGATTGAAATGGVGAGAAATARVITGGTAEAGDATGGAATGSGADAGVDATAGGGAATGGGATGRVVIGGANDRESTRGAPADGTAAGFAGLVFAATVFALLEAAAPGVSVDVALTADGADCDDLGAGPDVGAGRSGFRAGAFVLSILRSTVSEGALVATGLGGCGGSLASRSSSGSMRSSVMSSAGPSPDAGLDAGAAAAGDAPALSPVCGSLNANASRGASTGRSGSGSGSGRDLGSIMYGSELRQSRGRILQRARGQANLPAHRSRSARPRIVTPIALRPRAGEIRHRYCVTFRPGRLR
jgi:hypothetical protein